jgi:hypothetical protein
VGIIEGNPHSVRYDMFAEEISLAEIVTDIANQEQLHSIYIGAHGDEASICGLGEATISRARLRNMLRGANAARSIAGLYFGSCQIVTLQNAAFWLTQKPRTGLQWVVGYTKSVDWVDSLAVDMIFWSKYLHGVPTCCGRGKKSELEMVKVASSGMKKLMPTVFTELGFNVYYLDIGGALVAVLVILLRALFDGC